MYSFGLITSYTGGTLKPVPHPFWFQLFPQDRIRRRGSKEHTVKACCIVTYKLFESTERSEIERH